MNPGRDPTDFELRVYESCRRIPSGKVSTYRELARALDCGSAQAIGQALKRNPYAPEVPCHRVVRSDGRIGGFAGHTDGPEIERKIKLLRAEGVRIDDTRRVHEDDLIDC